MEIEDRREHADVQRRRAGRRMSAGAQAAYCARVRVLGSA
jgi:hypothetical protein